MGGRGESYPSSLYFIQSHSPPPLALRHIDFLPLPLLFLPPPPVFFLSPFFFPLISCCFFSKIPHLSVPFEVFRLFSLVDLMDSEQSFSQPAFGFHADEDDSFKQKHSAPENLNGCFDCNICLDSAHDPVVTLCGHLYCWPCIYNWLQVQSSSSDTDEQPKCPVCKTCISSSSLVPLYGRGTAIPESEAKKRQLDLVVPHRPAAVGINTLVNNAASISSHTQHQLHPNLLHTEPESFGQQQYFEPELQGFHQQPYFPHHFGSYASTGPSAFGNTTMTSSYSPTIVMFGEMVFPGMFASSGTSLFAYSYPNSYPPPGNGGPRRIRRQELQVEKSLSRVNYFLFFCLLLCLLLF